MKIILFSLLSLTGFAVSFNQLCLNPIGSITHAKLDYIAPLRADSTAVLLLFPGCNGDGKSLIEQKEWIDFALSNQLELACMSFRSEVDDLKNGKGYYYVDQGSGNLLLKAVGSVYGADIPLILYGFSGGAHFVSRFVGWNPERVFCWCAYSAAWWSKPKRSVYSPPGIIACGGKDYRLGASLSYFKEGRVLNKPWLWVSPPENAHTPDISVDRFFRQYAQCLLNRKTINEGLWIDVEKGGRAKPELISLHKTGTGWLPDETLLPEWLYLMGMEDE